MNRTEFEKCINDLCGGVNGRVGISLVELRGGEEFSRDDDWVLDHPASTIKLSILCATLAKVQEGLTSLDAPLVCKKEDKVPGSGVLQHLSDGTPLPLIDMLMLMIIQSDNSATNIVIEHIGTEYANEFFKKAGLEHTVLRRKLFDYEGIKKGIRNNISPRDLTKLLIGLEKREFLNEEFSAIGLDILLKQQITNTLQKYITSYWNDEGTWFRYPIKVGSKSGRDSTVEHDCGLIYTPNATIALTVLTNKVHTPDAIELIGRVAELAVKYFDPGALEKTFK